MILEEGMRKKSGVVRRKVRSELSALGFQLHHVTIGQPLTVSLN